MTSNISRRRWLRTVAIAASSGIYLPLPNAIAQPPSVKSSTTELRTSGPGGSGLPIQSRVYRLEGETNSPVVVTAIAADPRGKWLAVSGDDHIIRILDTSTFAIAHQLTGHRDVIRTLVFDPNGDRLVSAGNDGQLIVWNCNDQFALKQKMSGTPALACVRFAPDGREMAAVGFNNEIYLIGHPDRTRSVLNCHCNDLRAVAFRDDNTVIAVAGRSGDLHLFDVGSGNLTNEFPIHKGRIHDLVFHRQSNTVISVAEDGDVAVFDTRAQKLRHRIEVTSGKLFTAAILNSQMVAVAGSDNVIRIVNTDEGRVVKTLDGHQGSISTLAATAGALFSGSFDATLRRWTIADLVQREQRIAEVVPTVDR
ncbi:WD40 repeat domain-containing protein [Rubripirellula reticaptiva]|uniref:WD domain, G-beta repeat n=1 Tax=Rubripirellula reticaptiva TaxID=2528013 RepID=A0A5C6EIK3_9BACT|nr:WD40 repeat domain-containing protein [Rubripirellula reticaptiva]TWU47917.1 WD domain, G-beta repeat [Rubripirellula reticaptiva]